MQVSAISKDREEYHKVSYSGCGWVLDNEIYPSELRADQKGSILRSVMSQLEQVDGLRLTRKSKARGGLRSVSRKKRVDDTWQGVLSPGEEERRHYFLNCGVFGERQQNAKGKTRDIVYRCGQYCRCPSCKIAYHHGKSIDVAERFAVVMQANKVQRLRKAVFTLPENIRDQIKTNKQASGFRARIAKVVHTFYGCGKDYKGAYKSGRMGIRIDTHWVSTHEPWKESPHFHVNWVPLILEGDKVIKVDRDLEQSNLRWFCREWAKEAKEEAIKQGLEGAEDMPDELNVWHRWIPALKNLSEFGQARLNLWYDERSQLEDLEECVRAVEFDQELMLMRFRQDKRDYFAMWQIDDYMAVEDRLLSVKGSSSSYGWLRRFGSYAEVLGVKIWIDKDDFAPLPERSEKIQFKRCYESMWNKSKSRGEIVKRLYVKKLTEPDEPASWREVDPWTVHGEEIWIGSKKRYIYGVAQGRDPPDRGG